MDEKTIYQKYDELLASNTALSVENSEMAERIDKLASALEKISELRQREIVMSEAKNTKFDEWWEKDSGWGGEKLAEYNLAREAWSKALEQQRCRFALNC